MKLLVIKTDSYGPITCSVCTLIYNPSPFPVLLSAYVLPVIRFTHHTLVLKPSRNRGIFPCPVSLPFYLISCTVSMARSSHPILIRLSGKQFLSKYKLQINDGNYTESHLAASPSSHLSQILIYLHLYLQKHMNILLERRKGG